MPGLKVRKSKLPYATLNVWQTDALREFNRLRVVGLQVIERDIVNAVPDPEDADLIATQTGSVRNDPSEGPLETSTKTGRLSKALTPWEQQNERAVRDFKRRLEFGGPLKPALGETTANLLSSSSTGTPLCASR